MILQLSRALHKYSKVAVFFEGAEGAELIFNITAKQFYDVPIKNGTALLVSICFANEVGGGGVGGITRTSLS